MPEPLVAAGQVVLPTGEAHQNSFQQQPCQHCGLLIGIFDLGTL